MNDRYLYRAKRTDDGEWVEGCLLIIDDSEYRIATSCLQGDVKELLNVCAYEVDQSTICQCTEINDKNGKLIWENDICRRVLLPTKRIKTNFKIAYVPYKCCILAIDLDGIAHHCS